MVVALPGNEIQFKTGHEKKSWQKASLVAVAGTAMYWFEPQRVMLAHTVSVIAVEEN